jgi:hypothetical protein
MIDIRAVVIILAIYIVWIMYSRRTCSEEGFESKDSIKDTKDSVKDPKAPAAMSCKDARAQYLQDYPDVAKTKSDPWVHYQKHGMKEGRKWKGVPCVAPSKTQSKSKTAGVPSPVPLADLQQNFLQARQVEGSALDTKMSQRKGAAYLDLRPDVPVVMDRTAWMNQSSINDSERITNIQRQREAWGNFFASA